MDTLELYSARQRAHFTKLTSDELLVEERVIKHDLGEVLRLTANFRSAGAIGLFTDAAFERLLARFPRGRAGLEAAIVF